MKNYVGIDRSVLSGLRVISVDFNKLKKFEPNVVKYSLEGYKYFKDNRKDNFSWIRIRDEELFKELKIGVNIKNTQHINYCILDITIGGENNLYPFTVESFNKRLVDIKKYLKVYYGITIDMQNINLRKLELNINIELDNSFFEYTSCLNTLIAFVPKNYKEKKVTKGSNNRCGYFKVMNKSIDLKIYDKKEQLRKVFGIEHNKNVLRLEYTLKTSEKIKSSLGSNSVKLLTSKCIKIFLRKQIERDLNKTYLKHKENSIKEIKKWLKESQREKQWKKTFINMLAAYSSRNISRNNVVLIDLEWVKPYLKKIDSKNLIRNYQNIVDQDNFNCYKNSEIKTLEIIEKLFEKLD